MRLKEKKSIYILNKSIRYENRYLLKQKISVGDEFGRFDHLAYSHV